jgi:ribosomal protein L19
MNVIEMIEKEQMRSDIPGFKSGDTVKVHVRIIEGQKQRIQAFEGVVIRKRRGKFYGKKSFLWYWSRENFPFAFSNY